MRGAARAQLFVLPVGARSGILPRCARAQAGALAGSSPLAQWRQHRCWPESFDHLGILRTAVTTAKNRHGKRCRRWPPVIGDLGRIFSPLVERHTYVSEQRAN